MLETIIANKTDEINELESELAKERADCRKLDEGLKEKQAVLESYEKRFLGVRSLIERQDSELKESFAKLNDLKERLHQEEERSQQLVEKIQAIQLSHRGEIEEMNAKSQESEHAWVGRFEKQTRDFERQLTEKDKWFQSMKLQENAELHKLISDKEKESALLQDQLVTTCKDLTFEIEAL